MSGFINRTRKGASLSSMQTVMTEHQAMLDDLQQKANRTGREAREKTSDGCIYIRLPSSPAPNKEKAR